MLTIKKESVFDTCMVCCLVKKRKEEGEQRKKNVNRLAVVREEWWNFSECLRLLFLLFTVDMNGFIYGFEWIFAPRHR